METIPAPEEEVKKKERTLVDRPSSSKRPAKYPGSRRETKITPVPGEPEQSTAPPELMFQDRTKPLTDEEETAYLKARVRQLDPHDTKQQQEVLREIWRKKKQFADQREMAKKPATETERDRIGQIEHDFGVLETAVTKLLYEENQRREELINVIDTRLGGDKSADDFMKETLKLLSQIESSSDQNTPEFRNAKIIWEEYLRERLLVMIAIGLDLGEKIDQKLLEIIDNPKPTYSPWLVRQLKNIRQDATTMRDKIKAHETPAEDEQWRKET